MSNEVELHYAIQPHYSLMPICFCLHVLRTHIYTRFDKKLCFATDEIMKKKTDENERNVYINELSPSCKDKP